MVSLRNAILREDSSNKVDEAAMTCFTCTKFSHEVIVHIQHLLLACNRVLVIDQVDESVMMVPALRIKVG